MPDKWQGTSDQVDAGRQAGRLAGDEDDEYQEPVLSPVPALTISLSESLARAIKILFLTLPKLQSSRIKE